MILVRNSRYNFFVLFLFLFLLACNVHESPKQAVKIAFLSDVHFQDVYGEFSDSKYNGVVNPVNGKNATIRTMASQLKSTRLFNENYFAFLAALDDIAEKGIELVALPGDFSDDGQSLNVRGLKEILDEYTREYGMKFFITTGNHDPVRPFLKQGGKKDFLGEGGKNQPLFSDENLYTPGEMEHNVVVSKDMAEMGYKGILKLLGDFGLNPQADYLYWETPFTSYEYNDYQFNTAQSEAVYGKRFYNIPPVNFAIPDVSYLVEPQEGLWLLAIDANVYVPVEDTDSISTNPENYQGAGMGYNNVPSHKKHLIEWVKRIAKQAKELDKELIAFSHYPMVDFHNDASPEIEHLLGKGKLQTHRIPSEDIAEIFADAGVKIHFAGHLHVNDTGLRKTRNANMLVNVQVPSLAAYIPAYKLLTIHDSKKMEVETIVIDSVARFNEFFSLYEQEHAFHKKNETDNLWNKNVLLSENYFEFTQWHLKELVRLRFAKSDWNLPFGKELMELSGWDLLVLSQIEDAHDMESFKKYKEMESAREIKMISKAKETAALIAQAEDIQAEDFKNWNGEDLLLDFYKLRNADEMAFDDIGEERLKQYRLVSQQFLNKADKNSTDNIFMSQLHELAAILDKFMNGISSKHFTIDFERGEIVTVK